jgi:hypothetical protein
MSSSLNGGRQFTLMAETIAGNAARNNASPLRQKIPQESHVLEINGAFLDTKPAGSAALKKPPGAATAATIAPTTTAAATFTFTLHKLSLSNAHYSSFS